MGLLEIRAYLMNVKISSLAALAAYFDRDVEILRQMLRFWVQKGCVRCFTKTAACGGSCAKCPSAATEIYEWLDSVKV